MAASVRFLVMAAPLSVTPRHRRASLPASLAPPGERIRKAPYAPERNFRMDSVGDNLVGIGLYTPAEAGSLIGVRVPKLTRWLRGHTVRGQWYEPLWQPQVDLGDDKIYLSFRDLLEARVASRFIKEGLSPQKVRLAIELASTMVGDRPLSTSWLKTDGRAVFLKVVRETGGEPELMDLFSKQYAFNAVVDQSLRDVEFDGPLPNIWWPLGRRSGVLIDPLRSFGQPIERETSIPVVALSNAAAAEGSVDAAAKAWGVPVPAVKRAIRFQQQMDLKRAA